MLDIKIYTILLWITGITILSFDLVVYFGSKNNSSRIFAFFSSFVALWSISYGFIVASLSVELPLFLIKVNHILGLITSLGFVYFSLIYPDDKKPRKTTSIYLLGIGIVFFITFFFTDLMIPNMFKLISPDKWGWVIGKFYYTYCITFNTLWVIILVNIFRKIKYSLNSSTRLNQLFMFWGLAIGILPPAILNILLPFFGIYGLSWIGPIISTIWIYIIGYSIIRYRQMDVRVVITEVLAIALTVIFFINIFIQAQFGVWENITTFLVFLFLATYLIRGVLTESRQKEELRVLNETLEQKVAEQTKEVRKSYDLEKQARRELEKLNETKDQFIMITQHSLRTPLNNIQAGIKTLELESKKHGTNIPLERIKSGVDRLTRITNDFLAITSIKSEANILNLATSSLKPIIESIIKDLDYEIKQKSIHIHYSNDNSSWPNLNIDKSKIFDAILIIIENAVKYNVNKGNIYISTNKDNDRFILQINDSGTGISREDKEKISHNLFHRGMLAQKLNPIGMGVGLSIARAIIKAHHGEMTIESEGENQGTSVTVSIPFDFLNNSL